MAYDFAHGSGTANDPYLIENTDDFWGAIEEYIGNHFLQTVDLDLEEYSMYPDEINRFVNCVYDGGNHKMINLERSFLNYLIGSELKNLVFVSPKISNSHEAALIEYAVETSHGSKLENIIILGASVAGKYFVGSLIGYAYLAEVSDCFALGSTIEGECYVGGLIGMMDECTVERCVVHGELQTHTEFPNSYAGGFAGFAVSNSSIFQCGADVDVNAWPNYAGGFVGECTDSEIENCYSLGDVIGKDYVGGFVGSMFGSGYTKKCFSAGTVTATAETPDYVAGFCPYNDILTEDCYYDHDNAPLDDDYATPKTTAEMKTQSTFSGWNFSSVWKLGAFEQEEHWGKTDSNGFYSFIAPLGKNGVEVMLVLDPSDGYPFLQCETKKEIDASSVGTCNFYVRGRMPLY